MEIFAVHIGLFSYMGDLRNVAPVDVYYSVPITFNNLQVTYELFNL